MNGKSIFEGKTFIGFTNEEEKTYGLPAEVSGCQRPGSEVNRY